MSDPGLDPVIATYAPVLAEEFLKATVGKVVEKSAEGISLLAQRFREWAARRARAKLVEEALASGDKARVQTLVNDWLSDEPEAVEQAKGIQNIRVRAEQVRVTGSLDQRTMLSGGDHYSVTGGSGPVAMGPGARAVQYGHGPEKAP